MVAGEVLDALLLAGREECERERWADDEDEVMVQGHPVGEVLATTGEYEHRVGLVDTVDHPGVVVGEYPFFFSSPERNSQNEAMLDDSPEYKLRGAISPSSLYRSCSRMRCASISNLKTSFSGRSCR